MRLIRKLNIVFIACLLILSNFALTTQTSYAEEGSESYAEATSVLTLDKDYDVYVKEGKEPAGKLFSGSKILPLSENELGFYFQWGEELAFIKKSEESDLFELVDSIPEEKPEISKSGDITSSLSIPIYSKEGQLLAYAYKSYPFIQEDEDRYEVMVAGQTGYVQKSDLKQQLPLTDRENEQSQSPVTPANQGSPLEEQSAEKLAASTQSSFTSTTKFFKVQVDELPIYINIDGKLVPIGTLYKGQSYERISDAGNWHKIRFGKETAYVLKQSTIPAAKADIPNFNSSVDLSRTFTTVANTDVFDNSTGSLVKFAQISSNRTYPIIGQMGSWYKVNIAGRLGYVHSGNVQTNFVDSDLFFKVKVPNLGVFESQSGKLVKVGELKKDAIYKRVRNYGNWHEIKSGGKLLYVWKADTEPASSTAIKNINTQKTGSDYFTTVASTPIFDNSSGSLVEFGTILPGEKVYYIGKMSSWYKVEFGGRLGYIHENNVRLPFKASDRYFEVIEDEVFVYDNSLGYLKEVAVLKKGQTYERVQDYGNWHQIKYGRQYGYVAKSATKPSSSSKAKNWGSPVNSDVDFIAKGDVEIFDNSSGQLVPFMTVKDKERYPIIGESGSWWKVSIANRIGYIHKSKVIVGPIYQYSKYSTSLNDMLEIQFALTPQTDLYRNNPAYVHKDYVSLDQPGTFPTTATVIADNLNVRESASTNSWIYGTMKLGQKLKVLKQVGDWYEIEFVTWRNAKKADLARYLDPLNIKQGSPDYFQFLVLSQPAGISPSDIDSRILFDKGILKGKGQAFVQASNQYHINEIYLISHALLETGNGKSTLANGILVDTVDGKPVEPKMVYNMFGIGAVDSCPNSCGAETAYKNGWFSPEAAIIGGAKFISTMYINHPTYQQDTLYKMRWNPNKPGTHQYATDIAWAFKQVTKIKQLYDLLEHYTLYYDVPVYK